MTGEVIEKATPTENQGYESGEDGYVPPQVLAFAEGDLMAENIISGTSSVNLADLSAKIMPLVCLIRQIASQTHLIAINAGIEAAHAGEEGEILAVVAEEVGELAVRTATVTKEIEQILERLQRETSQKDNNHPDQIIRVSS